MADVTTQVIVTVNTTNDSDTAPRGPSAETERLIMANQASITIALILIMIGMGCTITLKEVWKNLRRPVGIVIGICCQFILMPFLGWSLAHIFQLSPGLALGTLAIATCPGGAMSNLLTFWTNGDTCLSVCMTTCSTIIGIGMMPLNLFIYSRSWAEAAAVIPYVDIIVALIVILIPGSVGMLIKWKVPKWCDLIAKICSLGSLLFIVIVIALVAAINPALFLSSWKPYLVAFFYPVLSFAFGMLIPWLFRQSPPKRRTIAFETGVQNGALALTIINLMMARGVGNPEMAVVPSLHSLFVMIEGLVLVGIYQFYIKHKPQGDEEKEMEPRKEKDEWIWPSKLRNGIDNPALSYENGNAVNTKEIDITVKEEPYQGSEVSGPPGYQDIWSWSTGRRYQNSEPVSPPVPNIQDQYPDYVPMSKPVLPQRDRGYAADSRPATMPPQPRRDRGYPDHRPTTMPSQPRRDIDSRYPDHRPTAMPASPQLDHPYPAHNSGRYGNPARPQTSPGYVQNDQRDSRPEYQTYVYRNDGAYPSGGRNSRTSTDERWNGESPMVRPGHARRYSEEDRISPQTGHPSSSPRDFDRDYGYHRYPKQGVGSSPRDFERGYDYNRYHGDDGVSPSMYNHTNNPPQQNNVPALPPKHYEIYPDEADSRSRNVRDHRHSGRKNKHSDTGYQTLSFDQRTGRQNVYSVDDQLTGQNEGKIVNHEPKPLKPSATFPRRHRTPFQQEDEYYPVHNKAHYVEDVRSSAYRSKPLNTRNSSYKTALNDYDNQSQTSTESERPHGRQTVMDIDFGGRESAQIHKPDRGRSSFTALPPLPSRILQRNDERSYHIGSDQYFQYPD